MATLSFIIPAKDEQDSVALLYKEIVQVVEKLGKDFEIIFVDDGSVDNTFKELQNLHKQDKRVKVIRLRGNFGKSSALQVGMSSALGDTIFTLDADLQDNPQEIPNFLEKLNEGYDLVSGWKKKRKDPLSKVVPSRIINFISRVVTRVPIHDINCGFKVYRKEVTQTLNLYGELYRYIPIIAAKENFKVGEIIIDHRARKYGKTKFGWSRGLKGVLDLLTVVFITGYLKRPGHFFGGFGLVFFSIGFFIGLYITYLRLTTGTIQDRGPLLFLGMLLMIVGVQLISTGLLGEMLVSFNHKQKSLTNYIKETLT